MNSQENYKPTSTNNSVNFVLSHLLYSDKTFLQQRNELRTTLDALKLVLLKFEQQNEQFGIQHDGLPNSSEYLTATDLCEMALRIESDQFAHLENLASNEISVYDFNTNAIFAGSSNIMEKAVRVSIANAIISGKIAASCFNNEATLAATLRDYLRAVSTF